MPAPFDYNVQRPDIMGAIGAYEAGRDRNRQVMQQGKQDMFAQYLPGALKGDQQALQGAQQNATPEQQMQLQNALAQMEDRQLQQTLQQQEKFARLAQWADTPEKWAQATQMAEAEGLKGASQVPFEQRGAKLAGMLSVKDQLDQEWKRREFQLQERNVNSQIGARNAEAAAANRPGGMNNTTFDNISGLRREFVSATKTYTDVRDAYGRIQVSAKNPSAAGDMSLIFNYMKMLDPGSTVREGEFATAEQATGIPQRIVNYYNKAQSGQRLNPEQRNDFVNRAGSLFNRQNETYLSTKKNYEGLAKKFGFDPSLVTFDQSGGIVGPQATPPPPAPAPQQVQRPIITGPNGEKMQLNAAGTAWEPMR